MSTQVRDPHFLTFTGGNLGQEALCKIPSGRQGGTLGLLGYSSIWGGDRGNVLVQNQKDGLGCWEGLGNFLFPSFPA